MSFILNVNRNIKLRRNFPLKNLKLENGIKNAIFHYNL